MYGFVSRALSGSYLLHFLISGGAFEAGSMKCILFATSLNCLQLH